MLVLVLEKSKMNIKEYFQKTNEESEMDKLEFLTKIIRGAARALAELHKNEYIHLNVKAESFVYIEEPDMNQNEKELFCKLTGLEKIVNLKLPNV
uniref:Protein kinase domain-containing protein n=1 Tax=Meloidogyne hapla TaxID=6305 RepID=A0A1I8BP14_MELHA